MTNPLLQPRLRVLLVDDDEDEFIITKDLLSEVENERYEVIWIADYDAALNALGQNQQDICLLDFRLGRHDGLELLREATQRGYSTPIILLTGQGDHAIDVEAMKAGAADYLVKGQLNSGLLERAIRYAIERGRATENLRRSEERYRVFFQSHPHPMWMHDLSTLSILAVNHAAIQRYGYSEEEFHTMTVEAIWAPAELPAALCFPAEFQHEFVQAGSRLHRRQDGTTFQVELSFHDVLLGDRAARLVLAQDVTEQKRAKDAMRESESRYQQLIDISPDGIAVLDAKANIHLANQQIAQLLGHRHWDELVGQHIAPYVAPEDMPRILRNLQKVIQSGSLRNEEYLFVKTDGTRFPVEVNASRVTHQDGSALMLGIVRDISQRKLAEAERHLNEARIGALLRLNQMTDAPLGVISDFALQTAVELTKSQAGCLLTLEPDTHVLTLVSGYAVDREAFNMLAPGASFEARESIPLAECLQLRQPLLVNRPAANLGESGFAPFAAQTITRYLVVPVCGGDRLTLIAVFANKSEDYQEMDARQVSLLMNDLWALWEHRRVEEALRQAEARAQSAIEKLAAFPRENPNPVMEFSADGSLTYFNAAAKEMAQKLGQQHLAEILPRDTADIVRTCLVGGKSRLRVETIHGDRTLSWSFFPILSSQVVHCYAGDITERLNLEAQLRHSQKLDSVGQLAAGVAHDFNNILTVIHGQASLLLAGNKQGAQVLDALRQICDSADRAMNLTRQLLTFSRRQFLQPRSLDLNEVVSDIIKMLDRLVIENIVLEFDPEPHLPPINADPGMMEQILVNLSINARDAMPNGGRLHIGTAMVTLSESDVRGNPEARPGSFVCLMVSDTGNGMDETVLNRIFEPFFTTKEAGKGTGLGLATVYGIVKQHRGWIEVKSRVHEGSQFKVFFPPSLEPLPAQEPPASTPLPSHGQERILIVEDEPQLREMIAEILEVHGYEVHKASSGFEAVNLWQQRKMDFDLLLTDMVMPSGLTGRELAEKLLAEKPALKVVYTTGYIIDMSTEGFQLEEGLNYVPKPFHPNALVETIRRCLDH